MKVSSMCRIPAALVAPSADSFRPVSGLAKMPLHLPACNTHAVVFEAGFAARSVIWREAMPETSRNFRLPLRGQRRLARTRIRRRSLLPV